MSRIVTDAAEICLPPFFGYSPWHADPLRGFFVTGRLDRPRFEDVARAGHPARDDLVRPAAVRKAPADEWDLRRVPQLGVRREVDDDSMRPAVARSAQCGPSIRVRPRSVGTGAPARNAKVLSSEWPRREPLSSRAARRT